MILRIFTRPVLTQKIPVRISALSLENPVGIPKTKPGRDYSLLFFHNTVRDYPRSMKLHPTGTILVRENSPDRVSFVCFPPHFHLPPRGCHHSYHASPTSTLRRLHFATLYISGTGSFLDLRMHTISKTGRVVCVTW